MLDLGHILISDLVIANLFMHTLPGMILLYLAAPFYTLADKMRVGFEIFKILLQVKLFEFLLSQQCYNSIRIAFQSAFIK